MEKQIDELGDLDVVDGDLGFALAGDDQVLLFRTFAELHVPSGYAVDVAAGENGVFKIGLNQ